MWPVTSLPHQYFGMRLMLDFLSILHIPSILQACFASKKSKGVMCANNTLLRRSWCNVVLWFVHYSVVGHTYKPRTFNNFFTSENQWPTVWAISTGINYLVVALVPESDPSSSSTSLVRSVFNLIVHHKLIFRPWKCNYTLMRIFMWNVMNIDFYS